MYVCAFTVMSEIFGWPTLTQLDELIMKQTICKGLALILPLGMMFIQ